MLAINREKQTIIPAAAGRFVIVAAALILRACSGSGGGASQQDPSASGSVDNDVSFVYSGPAPANSDVANFQREFYNNLVIEGRCGDCHTSGGTGTTAFVDKADVNEAYQAALTVVNLNDPSSSQVVLRVGSAHNCWVATRHPPVAQL